MSNNGLKIETAAKVGERITKFVNHAATTASELHTIMVQCALHSQVHGDVSLAERLINELMVNQDDKLKGAAFVNVAGIRAWFGTFTPMQMRGTGPYKLTLLDKDSNAYTQYLERGAKSLGHPDEPVQRSGNRAFWVTAGDNRPFWDMADVQRQQRTNIRPIGVKTLIDNVMKLNTDFNKAVEAGLIPEQSKETAAEFVKIMTEAARKFRTDHASDLLDEPDALAKLKQDIEKAQVAEANKDATKAGAEPSELSTQVGGNVTEGLTAENPIPSMTGTEG